MVLSNVFSFAALLIFHAFVTDKFGSTVANKSLILLLVFPGSLFYFFPYSESLFLLLSVLVFYFVDRRHYVAASVVAFFCPLAKAIGVFIVIPLFLNVWKEWRANRLSIQYFLTVLLPFLGYATVFLVMYYSTANPAEQFEAQGRYIAHATISKMFMPIHFAGEFFSVGTSHDFFHSPVDRLWFVLSIVGLCLLFKLDRILFFYALAITIVPAVTASFMSFTRYAAVIFPIFIAYGVYFIERRRRIAFMVTLSIMVIIHVIFAFLHMNNYWVA
jgi:Gpi18-like mannosyltransferase